MLRNIQLSEHFWLYEFTKSQLASRFDIDNVPQNQIIIDNLRRLCNNVLQPVRYSYNTPVSILSGYRSLPVNVKIGSKHNSQHITGQAADFEVVGIPNMEIVDFINDNLEFDQVILEYWKGGNTGWIHCSYASDIKNRYERIKSLTTG